MQLVLQINQEKTSEIKNTRYIRTNAKQNKLKQINRMAAKLGYKELNSAHFWLSLLSECISCYLYVFIVCSTRISWTGSIIGHEPNLLAMALSSGIAMMLLILVFRSVHVNPALTVSFLLTGRIPLIRALLYILVHCIGSVAAIAFLYSISVKGHAGALGLDNPHDTLESWQILTVEIVISFVVTTATYAACNFSSYTSARKLILEQVAQESGSLFPTNSNCDNIINVPSSSSSSSHQIVATSNTSRRPIVPIAPSFRIHPQNKGYLADTYAYADDNSDYNKYDYDNHRIYATQRYNSDSPASRTPPIEETMQNECQLLASNGFSLHVTSGQAFVIGLAYTLTSLSGVSFSVKTGQLASQAASQGGCLVVLSFGFSSVGPAASQLHPPFPLPIMMLCELILNLIHSTNSNFFLSTLRHFLITVNALI